MFEFSRFSWSGAERLWKAMHGLILGARTLETLVLVVVCAQLIMRLSPLPEALADQGPQLILGPLRRVLQGIGDALPGLVFIAILAAVLRFPLSTEFESRCSSAEDTPRLGFSSETR